MDKPVLTKEERKAKREARRQTQRENNVLRASKMHKLRLTADAPAQTKTQTAKTTTYHIGCSGWFYWHWRNAFYPEGLATKDWFAHYAKASRPLRSTPHSIHGRQRPL
jgi:hypothetical protein